MSRVCRRFPLRLLPAYLFAACVAVAAPPVASAAGADFTVAGDDSYGVAECMKPGMECGRVIADAWCEAHGRGHASAFGLADDVTGATKVSANSAQKPTSSSAVIIRCGD